MNCARPAPPGLLIGALLAGVLVLEFLATSGESLLLVVPRRLGPQLVGLHLHPTLLVQVRGTLAAPRLLEQLGRVLQVTLPEGNQGRTHGLLRAQEQVARIG
ncbi:MAG TPA: hypothetical protein VJ801_16755 [Polyangia bacterium]|nr:hypothetical protein [Polyangia bacterium]